MDLESVRSVSVYPRRRPKQLDYIFKSQSKHSSKFISQSKPLFLDVLSEPCIQKLSMTRFIIVVIVYYWIYCDDTQLTPPFCATKHFLKYRGYAFVRTKLQIKMGIWFVFIFHSHSLTIWVVVSDKHLPIQRIQDLFKFFQI